MGASAIGQAETNTLRQYVLGRLGEKDDEQVELRLLTDPAFAEEFDVVISEILDQYVADDFRGEERERVEQYFLKSAQRRNKLRFAWALRRVGTEQKPGTAPHHPLQRFSSRSFWLMAASVLLTVGIGFGIWWSFLQHSDVDRSLLALNAAFRENRPVEARISALKYAPFSQTRGTGQIYANENELREAELRLLTSLKNKPTPYAHHALGEVYLANREFDKAIEQFNEAIKGDPKNSQLYSDLGAAFLEKGKNDHSGPDPGKGLEEIAHGLENLIKALELNGTLLEAQFNRALCYEQMLLWQQAEDAWRTYLTHDGTSPWAEEARRKLEQIHLRKQSTSKRKERALEEFMKAFRERDDEVGWRLFAESYTSAGNTIANDLLTSTLNLPGDEQGRKQSHALAYLAMLAQRRAGDTYYRDVVQFYASQSVEQRQVLAKTRRKMEAAYDHFTKSRFTQAIASYQEAKLEFERLGDTAEVVFTEYRIAHCYVLQPNTEKGREIFQQLSDTCVDKKYQWLLSQALLGLANIYINTSEYSQAIRSSLRGLELSEQTGYADTILNNLIQLSEEHEFTNQTQKSLGFLQRALTFSETVSCEPMRLWGIYTTLAFDFDSLNLHHAALAYQSEALGLALQTNRPLIVSRSYGYLGEGYARLGQYDKAISNLQRAYAEGQRLGSEPNAIDIMANSSLQLGDVYRMSGSYREAIEAYDRCLRMYDQLNFQYYSYAAHRGKLLTYVELGDDQATEQELATVVSAYEEYRAKIIGQTSRNSFFEMQQGIYDTAINFALTRKHDPELAFEYSELSRARSLLDALEGRGRILEDAKRAPEFEVTSAFRPLTIADLQRSMPSGVQVLQYSITRKKLLVWLIRKEEFSHAETDIDSDVLTEKVRQYITSLRHPRQGTQTDQLREATDLYALLIQPILSSLDQSLRLCIVPDKIFHYLPFGVLLSPSSARYLIEDFEIEQSPSSNVFLFSTELARRKSGAIEEKLLSVGNPLFDKARFLSLGDLPAAAREAEAVGSYYLDPSLLLAQSASKDRVQKEMAQADVIHFALHYLVNERTEMLSKFILAKRSAREVTASDKDEVLAAYEIYKMRLPRARLIVLSACQTGIEQEYDGEGAINIARPFMVAGVPLIVASLWPVESESTAELMISFHRHRKQEGISSVEALRLAQLDLFRGLNPQYRDPYYWAAFVAIGGDATF